ncbi:MAG: hypothetical protein OEU36_11295 [Gammaproteobacteria bacterium]|nr:hypothetical protein [Gammaproteobacteria bacterium]
MVGTIPGKAREDSGVQRIGTVVPMLLLTLLCGQAIGAEKSNGNTVAVTANGAPVFEIHRTKSGRIRYELNNEWLLGMSLGVTPMHLVDSRPSSTALAPHFDLYDILHAPEARSFAALSKSHRKIRWYWTIGSTNYLTDQSPINHSFDFRSDLVRHFSLQTKAGFVMPFGDHWLLGGALSADKRIDDGSMTFVDEAEDDTSAGAYLGIRLTY